MTADTGEVRSGTVISFDPVLWQAKILMDGADVEATIPVGAWVPANLMVVDALVAILMFGETNVNDGVVVGPYGAGAAPIDSTAVTGGDAIIKAETTTSGNAQLQLNDIGNQGYTVLADRTNNRLAIQSGSFVFFTGNANDGTVQIGGTNLVIGQQLVSGLANNATVTISTTNKTRALLIQHNGGSQAIFFLNAAGVTVLAAQDGAAYSAASGTAGKSNVYYAGGQFTLENKSGGTLTYWLHWLGQA